MARLESRRFEPEYGKPIGPVWAFDRVFQAALEEAWVISAMTQIYYLKVSKYTV